MALITLVLLVLILCYSARVAYRWHRLCHIPGPFWTPFLAWPLNLERLSDDYGALIRVGPNQLVTSDIETILRLNSPCSDYSGGPDSGSILSRQVPFYFSGEKRIRSDAPPAHSKWNPPLEEVIDRQCGHLIGLIEQKFTPIDVTLKSLEMTRTSHWLILNVLRDLATSQHSDLLEEWQSGSNMSRTNRQYLWRFAAALLPRCFKRANCRSHGPEVYSEEQQWADQTADALTTIFLHIVSNPTAYGKLRAEIRSASTKSATRLSVTPVGDDTPPPPPKFPYLQAVVKEGCRMSTAATTRMSSLAGSVATKGDVVILGLHVPGGTEVGPDVPGIMRTTRYWGHDAEACRPERWLEAQDEKARVAMESALDILWGDAGSSSEQEGDMAI
ncbi:cytochrome P450 [Apiospora kogelbergensis]|uniref:Cytochrome P450 n=1 Tax=Apiospora kogelbergensis TaxID=1337665 RepID=A0AAW0QLT7_9PEZI